MANETDYIITTNDGMWRKYSDGFEGNGAFGVGRTNSAVTLDGLLRFTGIQVGQGMSVVLAEVKMYVESKGGNTGSLLVSTWGIAEDNTAAFTSSPHGRPKTTASHNYSRSMSVPLGSYHGLDVTSEANEIFARAGWASGNAMGFHIWNNGSPQDCYLFENQDGTNSYLVILLEARPNFYPSAVTVTAPASPSTPKDFGIKIAKAGFSAIGATEKQIHFSTNRPVLKAQFYGLTEVPANQIKAIPHRLGYKRAFLVFGREIRDNGLLGNVHKLPAIIISPDKSENYANVYIDNSDLNAEALGFVQGASSIAMQVYYYIFIDDIEL